MTPIFAWNSPPAPESLVPEFVLLPWHLMAAGGVMLVISLLLALVFRACKRRRKSTRDDRDAALRTALADLAAIGEMPPAAAVLEISRILRAYLAAVLADPALFETQEEFTSRHEALTTLPADLRQKLCDSLARLAELKYAPHRTLPPVPELLTEARNLLQSLHQGLPA